jgi:hypothetical protein
MFYDSRYGGPAGARPVAGSLYDERDADAGAAAASTRARARHRSSQARALSAWLRTK